MQTGLQTGSKDRLSLNPSSGNKRKSRKRQTTKCGRAYRQQAKTGSLSDSLLRQQKEKQKTPNDEMWTGLQTASRDRFSLWTPPQATKGKAENTKRRNVDGLTDRTQREVLSLWIPPQATKRKAENTKRRHVDGLTDSKQRQVFSLNPSSGNKRKSRKH